MSNDRQQRAARAEQMRKEREKVDRRQRNVITVAIVAVVVAMIAVGGYAVQNAGGDQAVVAPAGVNKDFGINYTAVDAGGRAGAKPVTVVIYEDFQCPFCKAFEAANGAYLDSGVKSGRITIEYRPISILDSGATNNYATRAASAGMCVLDKGGVAAYKKMHDILYANQSPESGPGLEDTALVDLATQAGVSGLDACINGKKYAPWVGAATEHNGVKSTPTVRINGKDVTGVGGGVPQLADLEKAIAAATAG
jgi:protein-disulfide isomerase